MITDKLFGKFIIFAIVLSFAFSLVSCKKNTSVVDSGTLGEILQQIADGNKDIEEVEVFASLYRIVLPEAASPALHSKARELAGKITSATDTYAEIVYDYQEPVFVEGAFEIILGRTTRYQSGQILGDLRAEDYVCKRYADSLVLGGINDDATITAIDRFCRDVLPEATKVVLLRAEQEFSYKGKYRITKAELGGFALSAYDIVYASNGTLDELYFAKMLQEIILESSGYFLDVISDKEYSGGKHISIGADPKNHFGADAPEDQAYVMQKGTNILALADSVRGYGEIISEFAEMLLTVIDKGAAEHWFSDGVLLEKKYSACEMLLSVMADSGADSLSIPKINAVTSLINNAKSNIVLSSVADADLMSRVLFGLTDTKAASENISGGILSLLYSTGYPVDITLEKLQGCVMLCGKVTFLDGNSLLVFDCYCESSGRSEWIARKIEELVSREGLPFVAMITEAVRTAEEVDIDGGWCVDKTLGIYASDNISADIVCEQSAYGVTFKDISITIKF